MPLSIEERYKQVFEQLRFASEIRLKILSAWGVVYAALAATFVWMHSHDMESLTWLVPLLAAVLTVLFWLGDRRNRSAIGAAKEVGAEIEAAPDSEIPERQHYFVRLNRGVRHGRIIDFFAIIVVVLLFLYAGYLLTIVAEVPIAQQWNNSILNNKGGLMGFNAFFGDLIWIALPIILSAVTGYVLGAAKTFREQKLAAYEEILPPIVKAAFDPRESETPDFNKAILKLWLFASRKAALAMDHALSILVKPERGNKGQALQQAIVVMREDIQYIRWRRKKVKPEEVRHFYMFIGGERDEGSNQDPNTGQR